jgi:hypothetical protein
MKPQRHPIETFHRPPPPPLRLARAIPSVVAEQPSFAAVHEGPLAPAAGRLKCVWSGYPHYERDCRSRIPTSVVLKAWQRERQLEGTVEGFFNFAWRSGVWLAFGSRDGRVRGVYCPTHSLEREARESPEMEP